MSTGGSGQPPRRAARQDGATAIFVAVDGRAAGIIAIADPVKAVGAGRALQALREDGLRIVMLTGDNSTTARAVATKLGIDEIEAGVLPERKSEVVQRLRKEGRRVAMVGDGVNDAPALAAADIGVAMGGGTDVAIESAGVTLLTGDLMGLVRARRLSVATMRNIRQNLTFAFLYNAAGVPIAAGVLYPVFGILLSPMVGAAAMALSSVSVIGNALRLARTRLDQTRSQFSGVGGRPFWCAFRIEVGPRACSSGAPGGSSVHQADIASKRRSMWNDFAVTSHAPPIRW